ncbi:cyanophycinase, partial [Bradyrhizobium sp. NBAIM08]|uniref:cyanophycinase n=1 Tax=Bradyrhizobium sp. NBAIM08 TaxID=2793815 RepID=UPI001CD27D2C
AINDEFMRLAGGDQARIVLIPAFPYETPEEVQELIADWKKYTMASIEILDARTKDEADTVDFVAPLKKATGVWLCGGLQSHLANLYNGTRTELELRKVLDRGGVVGGTSAGASFMSRVMIHDGTHKNADLADGLGLVQRAVID